MSEQDTSDWELNQYHSFTDSGHVESKVRVDANESMGVWLELREINEEADHYYTWIPPEVAEAIGTMLLYAAQKHREEFPNGE